MVRLHFTTCYKTLVIALDTSSSIAPTLGSPLTVGRMQVLAYPRGKTTATPL